MEYSITFPGDFDDYDWAEIEDKGWLGDVLVSWPGGECSLTFFDRGRLAHAIGVDIERLGYFAGAKIIVVDVVSRSSIEDAIARIADRRFLDLK